MHKNAMESSQSLAPEKPRIGAGIFSSILVSPLVLVCVGVMADAASKLRAGEALSLGIIASIGIAAIVATGFISLPVWFFCGRRALRFVRVSAGLFGALLLALAGRLLADAARVGSPGGVQHLSAVWYSVVFGCVLLGFALGPSWLDKIRRGLARAGLAVTRRWASRLRVLKPHGIGTAFVVFGGGFAAMSLPSMVSGLLAGNVETLTLSDVERGARPHSGYVRLTGVNASGNPVHYVLRTTHVPTMHDTEESTYYTPVGAEARAVSTGTHVVLQSYSPDAAQGRHDYVGHVKVDGLPRDVQQGMPVADGYFVLDIDSTPERDVTDGQFFVAFGLFLVLLGYAWSAVARRYEKWSATR